jgi:hypothetical protein|tara:strand:- start:707 stop:1033 length:327 start_codon:yes stop_codon:yes gene_type:complete
MPTDLEFNEEQMFDQFAQDPLFKIARKAMDIEKELADNTGLSAVLEQAKKDSSEAIRKLISTDATKVDTVRKLQNDARIFFMLTEYLKKQIDRGILAEQIITEEDQTK